MFGKDGKPYGSPCETKKSLLIGYDLMPLMGLRRMERRLATKGIVPHRCEVVSDPTSTLFAVARNGKIERDSVAWSTFCDYETTLRQIAGASFSSACGWIGCRHEEYENPLKAYWYTLSSKADRWLPTDLRRTRTYQRLIVDCVETIRSMGYSLVPVSIEPANGN